MFEGISCNHCRFHFSGIPSMGCIDENGEPAIMTLPLGSRPIDQEIRKRLPHGFFDDPKMLWSLNDYLCLDCKKVSRLISGENKNCLQCGSVRLQGSFELEGKLCPVCNIGIFEKGPPSDICY
ncbi:hypothetical protein ABGI61_08490 [Rheinheimera sp. FR7-31]|uniref:hypothetical protein n=1 Tax=Rheinheimera fenheensis TaxID=3152295 RepID=UPI00325DBE47